MHIDIYIYVYLLQYLRSGKLKHLEDRTPTAPLPKITKSDDPFKRSGFEGGALFSSFFDLVRYSSSGLDTFQTSILKNHNFSLTSKH